MQNERSVDLRTRRLMVAIPCYDGKLNIHAAFALSQLTSLSQTYGFTLQLAHTEGCWIITKARYLRSPSRRLRDGHIQELICAQSG